MAEPTQKNQKVVAWFSGDGCEVRELWLYEQFQGFVHTRLPRPAMARTFQKLMLIDVRRPLQVVSVACFTLPVDSEGRVRQGWNLPIEKILAMGELTILPSYGQVSVSALGCASVNWYSHSLWRPTMQNPEGLNTFEALKVAIDKNGLGLPVYEEGDDDCLMDELSSSQAVEQPLSLDNLIDLSPTEVDELWRQKYDDSQQRVMELVKTMKFRYQTLLKNEQSQNRQLLQKMDRTVRNSLNLKGRVRGPGSMNLSDLGDDDTSGWGRWFVGEMQDNAEGDSALTVQGMATGLAHAGIQLVTNHLGIGRVVIPPYDLQRYLESPIAYVAALCSVTEKNYRKWVIHYNTPACTKVVNGTQCNTVVPRCKAPAQYVEGCTDRCAIHQSEYENNPSEQAL